MEESGLLEELAKKRATVARRIQRLGRYGIKGSGSIAVEFGDVAPKFHIVKFDNMSGEGQGFSVHGKGQYSQTTKKQVEEDIETARAFARWIENNIGGPVEVNFNTDNNILDMTITALGYYNEAQTSEITRRMEMLVLGDL